MIHLRIDDFAENSKRQFACGIGPELPAGDVWFYAWEPMADVRADCPGFNPTPRQLGTPISELSGRPGHDGFAEFYRIGKSWGEP